MSPLEVLAILYIVLAGVWAVILTGISIYVVMHFRSRGNEEI